MDVIFPTLPPGDIWQQCATDFLQSIFDLSGSQSSLTNYRSFLRRFFASSADGPPKHPALYTRRDAEHFLHLPSDSSRSKGKPVSIATINQRHMIISSFYKFAGAYYVEQEGALHPLFSGPSPVAGMRYARPDRNRFALSADELDRFFAAIPTDTLIGLRDRAIFLMYFWTARRRSEICDLRWGDLMHSTIVDEHGKRRPGILYSFRGKGHKRELDTAELPGPAYAALMAYLQASGRLPLAADDPLFVPIFEGFDGLHGGRAELPADYKKPLRSSTIAYNLKKYVKLAGLDPERVSMHTLRHTAALERYRAGQDLLSIQKLLRHTSLDTTYIYLQSLAGTADDGAGLLEARFGHLSKPEHKENVVDFQSRPLDRGTTRQRSNASRAGAP